MEAASHIPDVALEDILSTVDIVRAAVGLAVAKVFRPAELVRCNGFVVLNRLFDDRRLWVSLGRSLGR